MLPYYSTTLWSPKLDLHGPLAHSLNKCPIWSSLISYGLHSDLYNGLLYMLYVYYVTWILDWHEEMSLLQEVWRSSGQRGLCKVWNNLAYVFFQVASIT